MVKSSRLPPIWCTRLGKRTTTSPSMPSSTSKSTTLRCLWACSVLQLPSAVCMRSFPMVPSRSRTCGKAWRSLPQWCFCLCWHSTSPKSLFTSRKSAKSSTTLFAATFSRCRCSASSSSPTLHMMPHPKKDLEGHNNVTRILFWIAGPLQLFLSTVFVGRFTTGVQRFRQFVNPSMMIPVVGNFIAALVIPYVKSNDMEAGDFTNAGWGWYGIAWTFWIVLLAINIHRMATDSPVEDRERALHMMFVAAPAMACSSYLALNNRQWDNFALINFWTAWLIQMSFFFGGYFRYFGAHKFEMSFWGYTFPFAALTVASINYYTLVTNHKSRALVLVSLTFATFSVVQCTWHTLNGLIKRQILIPEEKWGPLSMMKLTHHAFKFAAKQIDRQVKLFSDPPSAEEARAEFLRLWGGFFITYQEHARHEEEVVYLRFGELFPGITERTHGDHEEHGAHAEALNASINRFAAMPLAQGLAFFHQEVQPSLIAFMTELIKHLEFEEIHINPIPRKHIPLEMHIELLRSLFELTSANAWQIIIPFVLENQELHGRRTRYLRCLRWGLPDHMAQISRIVLLGTDQFMWERLTQEIPELEVNRHHTGARHTGRRYY
eukprot:TRINITY_DN3229_c0_g1_i1.p1 TRINITY_DN3229_c0_g1~~TRINITY_DN3229_c0_g1_i1.p1  ORF type:complete len:605 (-),score=101.67 TRINITY_DN3229_c0_g1_i1:166-1980(-)